jgi:hypothetical protein
VIAADCRRLPPMIIRDHGMPADGTAPLPVLDQQVLATPF